MQALEKKLFIDTLNATITNLRVNPEAFDLKTYWIPVKKLRE